MVTLPHKGGEGRTETYSLLYSRTWQCRGCATQWMKALGFRGASDNFSMATWISSTLPLPSCVSGIMHSEMKHAYLHTRTSPCTYKCTGVHTANLHTLYSHLHVQSLVYCSDLQLCLQAGSKNFATPPFSVTLITSCKEMILDVCFSPTDCWGVSRR